MKPLTMIDFTKNGVVEKGHLFVHLFALQHSARSLVRSAMLRLLRSLPRSLFLFRSLVCSLVGISDDIVQRLFSRTPFSVFPIIVLSIEQFYLSAAMAAANRQKFWRILRAFNQFAHLYPSRRCVPSSPLFNNVLLPRSTNQFFLSPE